MRDGYPRESLPVRAAPPPGGRVDGWPSLLVVDDDPHMLQTLVCLFERRGFQVAAVATVAEAKRVFQRHKTWVLAIADYHLPDGTGWELGRWLREHSPTAPPVLLMSGSGHLDVSCTEAELLKKPFTLSDLEARVDALLRCGRS